MDILWFLFAVIRKILCAKKKAFYYIATFLVEYSCPCKPELGGIFISLLTSKHGKVFASLFCSNFIRIIHVPFGN